MCIVYSGVGGWVTLVRSWRGLGFNIALPGWYAAGLKFLWRQTTFTLCLSWDDGGWLFFSSTNPSAFNLPPSLQVYTTWGWIFFPSPVVDCYCLVSHARSDWRNRGSLLSWPSHSFEKDLPSGLWVGSMPMTLLCGCQTLCLLSVVVLDLAWKFLFLPQW